MSLVKKKNNARRLAQWRAFTRKQVNELKKTGL